MPTVAAAGDRVAERAPEVAAQHRRGVLECVGECGHRGHWVRARKTSSRSGVCTVRPATAIESASRRSRSARSEAALPSLGTVSASDSSSRAGVPSARAADSSPSGSANSSRMCPPGTSRLSSAAVPVGHDPAVVEHGDPVGELVGLVEVLRGEEDGDAAGDEIADHLPHRVTAARVQARGRLVEEDQLRVAHERHRQVEPAAHAAGVGGGRPVGGVAEVEAVEQLGGAPAARGAAEVVQVGHQDQVLAPGEQVVDGRELPGHADRGAHAVGVGGDVVAGDGQLAGVGADQRREDLDHRGLAGAVGAEQGEDRPLGDVEVDVVEHEVVAERLAQALRSRS